MCSLTSRYRWLLSVPWLALAVTLSSCAWLDAKQRNIIYRPTLSKAANTDDLGASGQRYFLSVPALDGAKQEGQRIEMWWLPQSNKQAPTLLYLHGTFRHLEQNLPKIKALQEAGFSILAVEYRGWGQSTPITPSEQSIMQDAQLALGEMLRIEPRASHRMVYGHSMGSGVAVALASRQDNATAFSGMILESAFTSFSDVAAQVGLLGRLANFFNRERFASLEKIAEVKLPLLMIHGAQDTTVEAKLGRKLFDAANAPKEWLLIENGRHSDLHSVGAQQYQAAIAQFLLGILRKPSG